MKTILAKRKKEGGRGWGMGWSCNVITCKLYMNILLLIQIKP